MPAVSGLNSPSVSTFVRNVAQNIFSYKTVKIILRPTSAVTIISIVLLVNEIQFDKFRLSNFSNIYKTNDL